MCPAIERKISRCGGCEVAVEVALAWRGEAPEVQLGKILGSTRGDDVRDAAQGMPEFVQESGYADRPGGKVGADPDEAVDVAERRRDAENLRHRRTNHEVRHAVDAGSVRQIGVVEEAGFAEGEEIRAK